jgi:hypothetical protein
MVFRVVAEPLGDGGIAKEEGEVGEHVLTGRCDGARGWEVPGALHVLGLHDCFVWGSCAGVSSDLRWKKRADSRVG